MRENDVHAVHPERIALRTSLRLGQAVRRLFVVFAFALALLKGVEIVEKMVPHFLEIFGNVWAEVFFLEFFDDAIDQHRGRFLLQVAQLAGQLPRERQRFPVHHGEFLPELLVLSLDIFRHGAFEFPLVDHLGDVLNRHHLAFEHGENFGQRHRAHLHVAQRKLFSRDPAREIVHQFFFAHREAFDDPPFLPLERFAFKHLRDPPPQKIDSRLHVFFKGVCLAARECQQARPVRQFEIVHVATVERLFRGRVKFFNHARDGSAAAGARQSAHKDVVAGRRELRTHLQRPQRALLSDEPFAQFRLSGSFKGNARELAPPAQFRRGKLRRFRGRFGGHEILRARYSSTLKSGPGSETNKVLSSGYGRAFRPLHVNGQDARGRGYQDRAQHQTEHSEEADAANHTDENHQATEFGAPAEQEWSQDVVDDRGYSRANNEKQNGPSPMSREAKP